MKYLIDCDTGVDDAVALLMVLGHDVEVVGITCVGGNTSVDNACRNTLRVLQAKNRNDIKVYKGAYKSLLPNDTDDRYHGHDGLGDKTHDSEPDMSQLQTEHAANALVRLAKENKGCLNVIALGPLTNFALALRLDPEFCSNLQSFCIMGGNSHGVGNCRISKEFNFGTDPEAANMVLNEIRCPIKIVPWESCVANTLNWEFADSWRQTDTPAGRLIRLIIGNIYDKQKHQEKLPGFRVCDAIAVAPFLDPSLILESEKHYMTVELNGTYSRGQMIVDRSSHLNQPINAEVILKIDMVKAQKIFSKALE